MCLGITRVCIRQERGGPLGRLGDWEIGTYLDPRARVKDGNIFIFDRIDLWVQQYCSLTAPA